MAGDVFQDDSTFPAHQPFAESYELDGSLQENWSLTKISRDIKGSDSSSRPSQETIIFCAHMLNLSSMPRI